MAEFILVTTNNELESLDSKQMLINTDHIAFIEQRMENGETTTYLIRKGDYSALLIRETMAQLTMLLANPVGRYYTYTGLPNSFGPVSVPQIKYG